MKRTTFTRLARSLTVGLLIVPVAAAQPGPAAGAAAGPPPAPVPMPSDPQTNVGAPTLSFTGRTSPTSRSGATRVRPVSRYVVRT